MHEVVATKRSLAAIGSARAGWKELMEGYFHCFKDPRKLELSVLT